MLADFPCLLPFKAAVRQLSSKTQLGLKLLVDVLFRTMEYALTSVVDGGLVGYVSKVILLYCRLWDRQGWQEDLLEYKGSSSIRSVWLILLCHILTLCLPFSLKLSGSIFARMTKLQENRVQGGLISCVCHVDCTLHTVDRSSAPKACCSPAAEKERWTWVSTLLLYAILMYICGRGAVLGREIVYADQKVHQCLFWLLQVNTWQNLCAPFSLFRVWVIFIFWSANKFKLLVVHALLILVQGLGTHQISETVWEKYTHSDQRNKK